MIIKAFIFLYYDLLIGGRVDHPPTINIYPSRKDAEVAAKVMKDNGWQLSRIQEWHFNTAEFKFVIPNEAKPDNKLIIELGEPDEDLIHDIDNDIDDIEPLNAEF